MDEMRFFRERSRTTSTSRCRGPEKKPPEDLVGMFCECRRQSEHRRDRAPHRAARVRGHARRCFSSLQRRVRQLPRASSGAGGDRRERSTRRSSRSTTRADGAGKGGELRERSSRFATGGGVYDPLFIGAGPQQDGSFSAERVAKNLAALAARIPTPGSFSSSTSTWPSRSSRRSRSCRATSRPRLRRP